MARLMRIKKPEPGSARDLSSQRMKKKWADPEYREAVKARQREKWADPAYRAMIAASKGNPIPKDVLPHLPEYYKKKIVALKAEVAKLQKLISVIEYQCAEVERGGDPTHVNLMIFGDRSKGHKIGTPLLPRKKQKKKEVSGWSRWKANKAKRGTGENIIDA